MKYLLLSLLLFSCRSGNDFEPIPPKDVPYPPEGLTNNYTTRSKLAYIQKMIKQVNCVLHDGAFIEEISQSKFTYTDKSGVEVAKDLKTIKVEVKSYTSKNPLTSAIATTYPTDKGSIYLNSRKNPRADNLMVNTGIHEGTHTIGYSHGDNNPKGKEDSVPYKAGAIAEKHLTNCKDI